MRTALCLPVQRRGSDSSGVAPTACDAALSTLILGRTAGSVVALAAVVAAVPVLAVAMPVAMPFIVAMALVAAILALLTHRLRDDRCRLLWSLRRGGSEPAR